MSVNFRIIDGDYYSKYDNFVKLYNDLNYSVFEIKKIIGNNAYERCRKEALENGDIQPRLHSQSKKNNNYKYYHYDKDMNKYRVRKVKNGKYMSFGFYDTEEEAKQVVEKLKKVDWDKDKIFDRKE